jgi:predicted nuclease of restriction endonuclease-like (RecB) superfamily
MLGLYWDIGRIINLRQKEEGWGSGLIPRLAKDIRNELPELKGFSERNLKRMLAFYRDSCYLPIVPQAVAQFGDRLEKGLQAESQLAEDMEAEIVPQVVAQIDHNKISELRSLIFALPWGHNIALIEKVKNLDVRLWYMKQVVEEGWGCNTLESFIKSDAYFRCVKAAHNFAVHLPSPQSELAASLLKDPYIFDFLTIEEPFHERELEAELIRHVEKFLLELGSGFAFVGRQYHLDVGEQDFYIDLLFYHLKLRCFVVIDLKSGPFKPEYAGKLSFYCSVVDDYLRHEQDQKTIGLILCQNKNKIMAEYALSGIKTPLGISTTP